MEQERDNFRKQFAVATARLGQVDPERFLDDVRELSEKGDWDRLEDRALKFTNAQTEAFGKAATLLAEQRIVDVYANVPGALEDLHRFVEIGQIVDPDSKALEHLKTDAVRLQNVADSGDAVETVAFDGMSGVELNKLARTLEDAGKYTLAEAAARRSVPLAINRTGLNSTNAAAAIGTHAQTLSNLGRFEEAEQLSRQSLAIVDKTLGVDHPGYAIRLNNLANALQATGRIKEAEKLYRQALAIDEKTLRVNHPGYAIRLSNLAGVLMETGRHAEAEPMYRQALSTLETALGADHPDTQTEQANLDNLLANSPG